MSAHNQKSKIHIVRDSQLRRDGRFLVTLDKGASGISEVSIPAGRRVLLSGEKITLREGD